MLLPSERGEVVRLCKKMQDDGLTTGTSGNISVRDAQSGLVAISPSGVPYEDLEERDVVIVSRAGDMVEGSRVPSSELGMHLCAYEGRPAAGCVVHTHSPYATMLACLEHGLPPIYPNLACASAGTGEGGVRCMPFMHSHTVEFGRAVSDALGDDFALLLGHHGVLTCGPDAGYAYMVAVTVEFCAHLYVGGGALGEPRALGADELADCASRFRRARSKALG